MGGVSAEPSLNLQENGQALGLRESLGKGGSEQDGKKQYARQKKRQQAWFSCAREVTDLLPGKSRRDECE